MRNGKYRFVKSCLTFIGGVIPVFSYIFVQINLHVINGNTRGNQNKLRPIHFESHGHALFGNDVPVDGHLINSSLKCTGCFGAERAPNPHFIIIHQRCLLRFSAFVPFPIYWLTINVPAKAILFSKRVTHRHVMPTTGHCET